MKKYLLIPLLLISLNSISQSKQDTTFTDSTAIFSLKDISELDALIQKQFTIDEGYKYQAIFKFIQDRFSLRRGEWEKKSKAKQASGAKN